jgi:hypothetical protein
LSDLHWRKWMKWNQWLIYAQKASFLPTILIERKFEKNIDCWAKSTVIFCCSLVLNEIVQNFTIFINIKWYFHPILVNFLILRFCFGVFKLFLQNLGLLNFRNLRLIVQKQWWIIKSQYCNYVGSSSIFKIISQR